MDEGAFVIDYWAPSGTPLAETEKMAKRIEEILSHNPDVEAYVRRTGAELGLFATQTSRGDIQVVLRPAENDPLSLLRKPVRFQVHNILEPVPHPGGFDIVLCRNVLLYLSPDKKTAIRQLRKVLRDGGIKVVRDEFNIIDRRGDKLRCVFLLDLGAPGAA